MNIRYTDVLAMADRHTVMKLAMKEIADSQDLSVTFMAKPLMSEAGSSCHIHLSLWRGDDNAFPGDIEEGPLHVSPVFRHFLGGWMAHVPEVMPSSLPRSTPISVSRTARGPPLGLPGPMTTARPVFV